MASGGNIKIATQRLFRSLGSTISASSERGIDGVVKTNRPDVDSSAHLVVLPAEIIDVSGLVASGCAAGGSTLVRGGSQVVVTGRGGLPPTPAEATRSDTTLVDLGTPSQIAENSASNAIQTTSPIRLVEAQGWALGSKREVILTTFAVNITPDIPWLTLTSCNAF